MSDPYTGYGPKPRRRCCGCCSLYTCLCILCCVVLLLGAAIAVAALLLFRAPKITVQGVSLSSASQVPIFQPDPSTVALNLTVRINVDNPNVIGATLKKILGSGQSPSLPNVDIANGEVDDVTIGSKTNTTIDFPLTIKYSEKVDPNHVALTDMLVKCGLTGQAKQKIPLKYKVATTLNVIGIGIGLPDYTSDISFDCPIPAGFNSDLVQKIINDLKTGTSSKTAGLPVGD